MKQNTKSEIFKTIKEYNKKLINLGYEVLFMGLKGSQNYNLDTEHSDVDVIAVVKPQKYSRTKISTKVSFGDKNADEAQVCDIFEFAKQVRKGNCSYIEVINSDFKIGKLPAEFYNAKTNVKSYYHMMMQKYHALDKQFESKKDIIAKYGYDPKQLHHIVRLYHLLENYFYANADENNVKVTDEELKKYLISLKLEPIEGFRELADNYINNAKQIQMQLDEFVENDISDEVIYQYLEDLDNKIIKNQIAEVVSDTYTILNNNQYLETSFTELLEHLHKHFNIDIRNIDTHAKTIKANKPTDDFDMLDKVYSDFLSIILYEHTKEAIRAIAINRGIDDYDAEELQYRAELAYLDKDIYQNVLASIEFAEFCNQYHEILKEVPGFYQKYNLSKEEYEWKFTFVEGILIPNKVNDKIRNIQIRTDDKNKRSKYINFSSSKKTEKFYKYATKAHQGFHFITNYLTKNTTNGKTLVITEGFFKAYEINENFTHAKNLFKSQGIILPENYDVLSVPGLGANLNTLNLDGYNNIILAFDRDVKEGCKQTIKGYNKFLISLNNHQDIKGKDILIQEYLPKTKIDDDIKELKQIEIKKDNNFEKLSDIF